MRKQWKPRSIEFPFQIIWIQELPRHNTYFVKLNEHLSFLKTTLLLRNVMHFWWQCSQEPPFICYHLSLIRKKSIALVFLQQQCTTAISWGPWKYNKLIRVHAWYWSKIVSSARDNKLLGDIAPQKFEFDKRKSLNMLFNCRQPAEQTTGVQARWANRLARQALPHSLKLT